MARCDHARVGDIAERWALGSLWSLCQQERDKGEMHHGESRESRMLDAIDDESSPPLARGDGAVAIGQGGSYLVTESSPQVVRA